MAAVKAKRPQVRSSRGEWLALAGLVLAPQLVIWNAGAVTAAVYQSVAPSAKAVGELAPVAAAIREAQKSFLDESASGGAAWGSFEVQWGRVCGAVGDARHAFESARKTAGLRGAEIGFAADSLLHVCTGSPQQANRPTRVVTFNAAVGPALAALTRAGVPGDLETERALRDSRRRAILTSAAGVLTGLLCLALLRRRVYLTATETAALPAVQTAQPEVLPLDASEYFFFCEVFDVSPAAQVLFDGDGRILRMNRAAEALTGYPTAAVRRRRYWDALLDHANPDDAAARFSTPDLVTPVEDVWVLRDGRKSRMLLSRAFCHDESGRLRYVIAAATPAESRLDDEVTRTLVGRRFHEELSLIGARAELMLERMPTSDSNRQAVMEIQRASERAVQALESVPQT